MRGTGPPRRYVVSPLRAPVLGTARRIAAIGAIAAVVAAALDAAPVTIAAPAQDEATDARLEAASGGRSVRVRLGAPGGPVVALPLEVYVARVLAGEGEPRAGTAAQQALAIAIRTYAAANAGRHGRDGFDLCDTTHCQVLRPSTPSSRHAALTTAAQLLTYEGRPAEVFYSASCGGRSEAASQVWTGGTDFPYLTVAVDDVHAGEDAWALEVSLARVEQALRRVGFAGRRLTDVRIERRSASGRVTRLHVTGLRPDAMTGDDLRLALGRRELRSTQFTLQRTGRMLRFTGVGYGHGVGLCVVGAGRRAARGDSVAAILAQYYPGLRLESFTPAGAAPEVEAVPEPEVAPAPSPAETLARRVRAELATTLGIAQPPPVRLQIHDTLEAFRDATGRPWWVAVAVAGSTIDLAPLAILEQRDGLDAFVRRGVAEALMAEALADRPAWVRVGGARYYSSVTRPVPPARAECPSDAELLMAVSAPAYRVAELRAEACFARALARAGDWRRVR